MGKSVAVLGAGISGLSAAYALKRAIPQFKIQVLEAGPNLGGVLETRILGDHLFEMGARGLRSSKVTPTLLKLFEDLGLSDELIYGGNELDKRYIFVDGKLECLPSKPWQFFFSPALKGIGKALLRDFFCSKGPLGDESIGTFSMRHFGSQLTNTIVVPMVAGIYAGDIEKLSLRATFPALHRQEQKHRSLIKVWWHYRKCPHSGANSKLTGSKIVSFRGGIKTLIEAYGRSLKDNIHLNTPVRQVVPFGTTYKIVTQEKNFEADFILSTLPAYAAAKVFTSEPKLCEVLHSIEYSPVAIVPIVFENKINPRSGFGHLIAPHKDQVVLGVYWNDKIFPENLQHRQSAKLGSSFSVILGGSKLKNFLQKDSSYFVKEAVDAVKKHLMISQDPIHTSCKVISKALPQYNVNHLEKIKEIKSLSPKGLFLRGNFMGGVGIPNILNASETTSRELIHAATSLNKHSGPREQVVQSSVHGF